MDSRTARTIAIAAFTFTIAMQSFCFYNSSAEMSEVNRQLIKYNNRLSTSTQKMIDAQTQMENTIMSMLFLTQSTENLTASQIVYWWNSQIQPKLSEAKNSLSEARDIRSKASNYWEKGVLNRKDVEEWEEKSQQLFYPMLIAIIAIFITLLGSSKKLSDRENTNWISIFLSCVAFALAFFIPIFGL